jgi:F-type H+-transporting ATPase subunit epsilon
MATIDFKIVTPRGIAYHDEIQQITVPTASGEITVLPKHTPLVSLLRPGEMTVVKEDHKVHFAVSRGVVEVRSGSEVIILANSADRAEEINLAEAEAARKRAQAMLADKENLDDVEFSRFQTILDRELARLKVGNKYL